MSPARPWTVNRPGPLTQRADNLWTIDDQVPGLPGATRRMSIVRRRDGALLFYNAIPVPEETLIAVRALGPPAQLVIPNQFHALDAAAFVAKLGVTPWAPPVAVAALAPLLTCRPIDELPQDDGLRRFTVEGFRTKEALLLVDGTLLVADLVTNAPHTTGLTGLFMRLLGFTGAAPKLPRPVRRRVEVDTAAVRALLNTLADQSDLKRIVPSHGDLIEVDAPRALRQIASAL
jgi:hypothetical protein